MTKKDVLEMIRAEEQKLQETLEAINWNTGPVRDAMKLTVPMMQGNINLLRAIVELIPDGEIRIQ